MFILFFSFSFFIFIFLFLVVAFNDWVPIAPIASIASVFAFLFCLCFLLRVCLRREFPTSNESLAWCDPSHKEENTEKRVVVTGEPQEAAERKDEKRRLIQLLTRRVLQSLAQEL